MGRRYVLSGENLTLGTGSVLAAIQSAAAGSAGSILEIKRIEVSQSGTATAAQVRLWLSQRNTAGTLTAATCGVNSSADSGGTYTDTWPAAVNNLGGETQVYVPEERPIIPPSTLVVVRFATAPGTTTGWTVAVVFEEIF
jgi:hypothetical protein